VWRCDSDPLKLHSCWRLAAVRAAPVSRFEHELVAVRHMLWVARRWSLGALNPNRYIDSTTIRGRQLRHPIAALSTHGSCRHLGSGSWARCRRFSPSERQPDPLRRPEGLADALLWLDFLLDVDMPDPPDVPTA